MPPVTLTLRLRANGLCLSSVKTKYLSVKMRLQNPWLFLFKSNINKSAGTRSPFVPFKQHIVNDKLFLITELLLVMALMQ